jgi:general secretion pathway protein D
LHVIPEVSSVAGTVTKTVAGTVSQADIYDIRKMETRVLIPSGHTLVLGGLISDDRTRGYTKVPGLGDIPILGGAFRSKSNIQVRKNLVVFITPTIVRADDFTPTQTDFLKTRPMDDKEEQLSAFNSAKPKDWSNRSGSNSSN